MLLTTAAGLATTVGSAAALLVKRPGKRFMATTLGFAGGVMVLVSLGELLPEAAGTIGRGWSYVAFFAGFVGMWAVDVLIPHDFIAERHGGGTEAGDALRPSAQGAVRPSNGGRDRLRRTGLLLALGVGIHNFPEGMATLGAALEDADLGVAVAVAVAVHNIPEGLAVAVPIYAATGSRRKAFLWSFLSGMAEPVGAGVALLVLLPFMTEALLGATLAVVAGLMVFIALDELVPASREYGHEHHAIAGAGAGMAVMALSLWLVRH